MSNYILYTHTDSEITTISEFLNLGGGNNTSIVNGWNSKSEFLNFTVNDKTNLERIYTKYNIIELKELAAEKGLPELDYKELGKVEMINYLSTRKVFDDTELLKTNTTLVLPKDKLFREIIAITGKNQLIEYKNFNYFLGDHLTNLVSDPLYKPTTKYKGTTHFTLNKIVPRVSVWVWSRALDEVIDISDFIENIGINVNKSGGNFNITLPPISYNNISTYNNGYLAKTIIDTINPKDLGSFYFHNLISTNDLVFIKFEELDSERIRIKNAPLSIIPFLDANNIYDMIGLVDNNSQDIGYNEGSASIVISGRDLMKVLIEDGSYFYTLTLASGMFLNSEDDSINKRLATTGKFNILLAKSFRSVKTSIQFIINQLSNMEVVPDKLFAGYGAKRSKVYKIDGDTDQLYKEVFTKGIWQIIKVFVDESVSNRRIVDDTIAMSDGSMLSHIYKLCQEPFVEFYGDTYGSFYDFIVRQPPFTGEAIRKFLSTTNNGGRDSIVIDVEPEDIISESLAYNDDEAYSWYEIIPQGNINGTGVRTVGDIIPSIYFPAYGKIWGSRRMSVVTNYIPYVPFTGTKQEQNDKYFLEQILNDYQFIIDSNCYLPFTRKGTITINPDRRIKRGTFIRNKRSQEIYYVDAVSNVQNNGNESIDRYTTLNVSRGMYEKYIFPHGALYEGRFIEPSYFNIIDTEIVKKFIINKVKFRDNDEIAKVSLQIKKNFGVNEDIFNFFLKRKEHDRTGA